MERLRGCQEPNPNPNPTDMVGLSGVVYELACRVRVLQLSALTCLSVGKYSISLCRTPEVRALIRKGQGFIQFS